MGLISGMVAGSGAAATLSTAAQGIAEVFRPNATEGQRLSHEAQAAALKQLGAEFELDRRGWFDRFVDGLNRLPRPMLALGTLGLFVFAMADPLAFSARMEGLAYVPEPLWWLLGSIVGFYFGAREMHYVRRPSPVPIPVRPEPVHSAWHAEAADAEPAEDDSNPALADWKARAG